MIPIWSPQPPDWSGEERSLLPSEAAKPADCSLKAFVEKSDTFPIKFPLEANRCKTLKLSITEDILRRNINSVYPILHENVLHLYSQFILHKRQNGSPVEKLLYKDMDLLQFVDRLLTKRAVMFMGKRDSYLLLNGKKGSQKWESIGTVAEKPPLILKYCLSYGEIKLSAFLSVSSYTVFTNLGDRKNFGIFKKDREKIQDEGVIIGIIGPRLVKEEVMEYQELIISQSQNTKSKGYGKVQPPTIHQLFAKFYDEECLEYKEVLERKKLEETRYTDLSKGEILDNFVYYKRLIFTVDSLFIEANHRALEKNTTAYVHVVGIGLGVWKKHGCQNKIFMDTCGQRLQILGKHLSNISDVCFSYIQHDSCLNFKHGSIIPLEGHPLKGIKVHICKREPHTKLTGKDNGKLLIVSYAWDGNALPGNEYWNNKLGSSGDSAAASSTQISELHNPFINAKVCAANLKVVVGGRIVGTEEYVELVKRGRKRTLDE